VASHAEISADAVHDVADISPVNPRRYPATDLLWGVHHHSQAKGQRRAA
jgi:DNA (cytosine-5)-methyltransferase 1